jgi:hypothetical protein
MKYQLCWQSVDGAGSEPASDFLGSAMIKATTAQSRANQTVVEGYANPWEYQYSVRDANGRTVFRPTRVRAHKV